MKTEDGGKAFDCVKWTRRIRDQIHEETAGMSREERREWYSQRPTDPVLARLFDRRKAPEAKPLGLSSIWLLPSEPEEPDL